MWYSYVSSNALERVLLEKLMVNRLVKKLTKFDGDQNVVTVFTTTKREHEEDRRKTGLKV